MKKICFIVNLIQNETYCAVDIMEFVVTYDFISENSVGNNSVKGCRMGRSDKVSLWFVSSLINTRFGFFILE